jgi:hypothetical protein
VAKISNGMVQAFFKLAGTSEISGCAFWFITGLDGRFAGFGLGSW